MATIYALRCPLRKQIRYIGKANDAQARLRKHVRQASRSKTNTHRLAWIRQLLRKKTEPELVVLVRRVRIGFNWRTLERFFIASARHFEFPLTNGTEGGEGVRFIGAGKRNHSRAMKKLWSDPKFRAKSYAATHGGDAAKKRGVAGRNPTNIAARKAGFTAQVRAGMSATRKTNLSDPIKAAKMRNAQRAGRKNYQAAALRRDEAYYQKHLAGVKRNWAERKARSLPDAVARFPELSWVYGVAA